MPIRKPEQIRGGEITPPEVWTQRRRWLRSALAGGALLGAGAAAGFWWWRGGSQGPPAEKIPHGEKIPNRVQGPYSSGLTPTGYEAVTSYNNFVELGSGKRRPAERAGLLKTRPWHVRVDGECEAPGGMDIEEILKRFPQEDRIYRFRCVEAWAMVVPWVGFPLADLLRRFRPTSRARYVAFEAIYDPDRLPGQSQRVYDWPYREGLRIDEAMHPLTLLATGLYGELMPNQNGAPVRLIVPWKYGFKSIKSIVRIRFTEEQPVTTWNRLQPDEYGFYANVNPHVSHPRWSQRDERMLGAGLFAGKRPTAMLNGYAQEVAGLYRGMDLRRFY